MIVGDFVCESWLDADRQNHQGRQFPPVPVWEIIEIRHDSSSAVLRRVGQALGESTGPQAGLRDATDEEIARAKAC